MPAEARDYEPLVALDGGSDGLAVFRRIAAGAPGWLVPGGQLFIETSEAQVPAALDAMSSAGLSARMVHSDEFSATVVIGALPV